MKVAYSILHKLGTKQEPMVRPGDRVSAPYVVESTEHTVLCGKDAHCLNIAEFSATSAFHWKASFPS